MPLPTSNIKVPVVLVGGQCPPCLKQFDNPITFLLIQKAIIWGYQDIDLSVLADFNNHHDACSVSAQLAQLVSALMQMVLTKLDRNDALLKSSLGIIMRPLDLVTLPPLMQLTNGKPEIKIGLIDGLVATHHPELAKANIREIIANSPVARVQATSAACQHGTLVAGVLCGQRNSVTPAICPGCTVLVRPVFTETGSRADSLPSTTPQNLSVAILDCLAAGAQILNLSVALDSPSSRGESQLEAALNQAAKQGAIVVAAAGNQGTIGSSAITRHPWVIPVVACDLQGRPTAFSNLAASVGRRGLTAPGQGITSLSWQGTANFSGTSAATPFVTGAIALLWSRFPQAAAAVVKSAITQTGISRRTTVVPPRLDAWRAYQWMANAIV
jgi:subtilisin family serine protease